MYIYEFDDAITFRHQSISLFSYLDNFLEKDKTGLPLQINNAWSVFYSLPEGWSIEEVCTFLILSLNVKNYIRFIENLETSFCFFYLFSVMLDKRFVH